ncbi:MAG: DoxX family protein [Bacteroidota bacterium]
MMIQKLFFRLTRPVVFASIASNILITIPRVITGLLLTLDFGSSKFGLPWSNSEEPLGFLEVASWFPRDVAEFGIPFSIAPYFFAWMGAASEAIGGLLLAIGLQTRLAAFFIACTMLVAIFFQKWGQGTWGMLPAMGFLWVALYAMVHGSGKWGIDYFITKGRSVKNA